jgi:hypothetical protein
VDASLSKDEVRRIVAQAAARGDAGDPDGAWAAASPLWERQADDPFVARGLLALVEGRAFSTDHNAEVIRRVFAAHGEDDEMLGILGRALETARDMNFLNAAPPADPVLHSIVERLRAKAAAARGGDAEIELLTGLATSGRVLGRAWDSDAEGAYRRLVELRPDRWQDHYNLGLFFKVRGRFAEALAANRRAASLCSDDESVQWNLGISATGARDGATALATWRGLGQTIDMGRFALPEGPYETVKVRLAERPVAERGVEEDDPGQEETIWIERLSPCHGIVRCALFEDLGVDYGDVVLFDGAPVTHHKYGDRRVPVFPHLATLERRGYRIFPFAGTQPGAGVIAELSSKLPEDAVLYSHTEQVEMLCAHCWESRDLDRGAHRMEERHVVRGKLCTPPHVTPRALRDALDAAVLASKGVRVLVPELSHAAGDDARAEIERRQLAMLEDA